jgi:hypothetical protein
LVVHHQVLVKFYRKYEISYNGIKSKGNWVKMDE